SATSRRSPSSSQPPRADRESRFPLRRLVQRGTERSAQRGHGAHRGSMILDVPIGSVESLPDPVQVGLSVGSARRLIGAVAGGGRRGAEEERADQRGGDDKSKDRAFEAILHRRGSRNYLEL